MGRKPLPTNLKVVKGTARKNRINKNEPKPKVKIGDPPEYLKGYALEFWNKFVEDMEDSGIITGLDEPALELLCKQYHRWRILEEKLEDYEEQGFTDVTSNGNVVQHALAGMANAASKRLQSLLSEFGITPSSRSNITKVKSEKGNNPWQGM